MSPYRTRAEAKAAGANRYFLSNPCPNGHMAERLVSNYTCIACSKNRRREWMGTNRDSQNVKKLEWYRANRADRLVYKREYFRANRTEIHAKNKTRRLLRHGVTPEWADLHLIQEFYREARQLTDVTGTPHDVDHIVPLNHPLVCGLHVHHNLQVLTHAENEAKGNRWWPDMFAVTYA